MKVNLNNISIVLNEPHYPENIGAAARAARNMGLKSILAVNPVDCNVSKILKMATHNAEEVVAAMEIHGSLAEALAPFGYIVGTTARVGSGRKGVKSPRRIAVELIEISRKNRIAILFGNESSGLSNEHLRYCDSLVTIHTSDFTSINLAQAVMIIAYEIFTASSSAERRPVPRLADRREIEEMYAHVREMLIKINFINPENPDYWMMSVRRFFSRIQLRGQEVRLIRGLCRQIDWYCGKRV